MEAEFFGIDSLEESCKDAIAHMKEALKPRKPVQADASIPEHPFPLEQGCREPHGTADSRDREVGEDSEWRSTRKMLGKKTWKKGGGTGGTSFTISLSQL